MRRSAVFRADASRTIGGGHVSRCLVLADALRQAGWSCRFVVAPGTVETFPRLGASSHAVSEIDPDPEREVAATRSVHPDGCDLLVVDHYDRDSGFERSLRPWARRILVIDDLADRSHDCDYLLDQGAGRDEADYRDLVPPDARLLIGPHFALLRPEFAAVRASSLERRVDLRAISRVLVSFGSVDRGNLTAVAVRALGAAMPGGSVDVLLGPAAPHVSEVRGLLERAAVDATLHVGTGNVANLLAQADLALGAGGVSALERCCLAVPSLIVTAAANQEAQARALERAGAAVVAGEANDVTAGGLRSDIEGLLADPHRLARMSSSAAAMCDGQGAGRTREAVT